MYEVSFAVLNVVMVLTTLWLINKFLHIFLEKKKKNIFSIIAWVLFGLFQILIQYNVGKASGWITIISIIFVLLIAISSFHSIGKKIFFIIFYFHAIWAIIEMFVFYGIGLLRVHNIELDLIGAVISKIIMVISVFAISKFWKKEDNGYLPTKVYLYLFIVPMGSIYIAIETFFTMNANKNVVSAMITFSILLSFNLVIFELYSNIVQFFIFENENTIYTQQIEIMSRNTKEQKKMMENFHEEKHNLINELIVLKHSIASNDTSTMLMNLNQIINAVDNNENISNTGNDVVDAIINFKYVLARDKGIKFVLKIFIPEEMPIYQCDLGIVIGNVIDNAIEATDLCNNEEKFITIMMGVKKEAFIMVIKNPFEHQLKICKDGNFLSTKKEQFRHGYGVNSIKRVAEKYDGDIITEIEKKEFSLTVTLAFK